MNQKIAKKLLLEAVIREMNAEREHLEEATRAALEAATSAENQPENQYDTRALEASYLAAAQGKRLSELKNAIGILNTFPIRENKSVDAGSLVELESGNQTFWYYLLPFGAGIHLEIEGKKITVVSLESPLGKALLGKKEGELFEFFRSGGSKEYQVLTLY